MAMGVRWRLCDAELLHNGVTRWREDEREGHHQAASHHDPREEYRVAALVVYEHIASHICTKARGAGNGEDQVRCQRGDEGHDRDPSKPAPWLWVVCELRHDVWRNVMRGVRARHYVHRPEESSGARADERGFFGKVQTAAQSLHRGVKGDEEQHVQHSNVADERRDPQVCQSRLQAQRQQHEDANDRGEPRSPEHEDLWTKRPLQRDPEIVYDQDHVTQACDNALKRQRNVDECGRGADGQCPRVPVRFRAGDVAHVADRQETKQGEGTCRHEGHDADAVATLLQGVREAEDPGPDDCLRQRYRRADHCALC
mmetsp:Transcript_102149/g.288511  ORF Transcript_102149/g.288511 Transcript_102149/m.288511 type:complete len:313 (-) Transcript_102149:200-1138(-)